MRSHHAPEWWDRAVSTYQDALGEAQRSTKVAKEPSTALFKDSDLIMERGECATATNLFRDLTF